MNWFKWLKSLFKCKNLVLAEPNTGLSPREEDLLKKYEILMRRLESTERLDDARCHTIDLLQKELESKTLSLQDAPTIISNLRIELQEIRSALQYMVNCNPKTPAQEFRNLAASAMKVKV